MTASLRWLVVYPAYGQARVEEEDVFVARLRARGIDARAFGIPCEGGWWPFAELDRRYRNRDRGLLAAYESLQKELADRDVLVAAGGAMLHPELLDRVGATKLLICADDPENTDNLSRPVAAHFDHCFVVNAAHVGDYASFGAKSASWLPPVLRPERVDARLTERRILYGHRDLDLVLCCDRAFGIGDRSARIERLLAEFPDVHARGRGFPLGPVEQAEVVELYGRAKIGWNLHHSTGPCNTRLLELPANGVLQICDNRRFLGPIFELDREIVGFDTIEECIEKTRHYLAHDDERRRIAAAGFARVQADYTEARMWDRVTEVAASLSREAVPSPAPIEIRSPSPVANEESRVAKKPKVWLLADRRGWAYDREARAMQTHLANEFECRIAYVQEQPDLSAWDFDLVWVFFWGETWHQRFVTDPRRVVKMIGSHRWQNEAAYGPLDPSAFAEKHLADAGHVAAISKRLQTLVATVRDTALVPQGIDPREFAPARTTPSGPLRVGWAGNQNDACKGLVDVLRPACEGRFELRIAGGNLDPAAMARFYGELDVLCVASNAEGGPLPLLEALACGAFVVTTDVGIAPEVIRHGDNGLVVARTPAAFRAALHWCEANLEFVRSRSHLRAQNVHATRSWDATIDARRIVLRRAFDSLGHADEPAQPTSALDRLHGDYHAHLADVSGQSEDTFRAASAYYRAELRTLLPKDRTARIAEVGCGFGHLLRFLAESGYSDLTGCDLDAKLAAATAGRLRGRANVVHREARAFLQDHCGRFDLVLAFDLLEHFDLEGALAFATAARESLRPGGIAVFRTPNMANVLGGYSRFMDLTHRIGFTEQSAGQLLRAAGFAEVAVVLPEHEPGPLRDAQTQNRQLHEQLFAQQDRSRPKCFDKNVVLAAKAPVLALRADPLRADPMRADPVGAERATAEPSMTGVGAAR